MKKILSFALVCIALACSTPAEEDLSGQIKVTTGSVSGVTYTSATLSGNYTGAAKGVYDYGFYYGNSRTNLKYQAGLNASADSFREFTADVSSLETGTEYFYQAYVTVLDKKSGLFVDVCGEILSFSTREEQTPPPGPVETGPLQYLGCYEIPAINLMNKEMCSASGPESFGDTKWYGYRTEDQDQMVVTHTYKYESKQYRNYTCLVDRTKLAPLWSAFVMHQEAYPDNNVGRVGSWTPDPAVPESWQQSSSSHGYSRGHFVASDYRQAARTANQQTFYYTNQALQQQDGFNSGVWSQLENAVKGNAPSGRDTLYVVVGLLYEQGVSLPDFGSVPCPSHFYKLLMKCGFNADGAMTSASGCAYLFTNESHSGHSYSNFITSIDEVERRSGFDFFANVPAALQEAAESSTTPVW